MISYIDFEVFYTQHKQQLKSFLQTLDSKRNEQGRIDNSQWEILHVQDGAVKLLVGVFSNIPFELAPHTNISQLSQSDIIHVCCIIMDKYQLTLDMQDYNNISTADYIATYIETVDELYNVVLQVCLSL